MSINLERDERAGCMQGEESCLQAWVCEVRATPETPAGRKARDTHLINACGMGVLLAGGCRAKN